MAIKKKMAEKKTATTMQKKEDMKKRGLASPDYADALACTFFVKVARSDVKSYRSRQPARIAKDIDYKIFG